MLQNYSNKMPSRSYCKPKAAPTRETRIDSNQSPHSAVRGEAIFLRRLPRFASNARTNSSTRSANLSGRNTLAAPQAA